MAKDIIAYVNVSRGRPGDNETDCDVTRFTFFVLREHLSLGPDTMHEIYKVTTWSCNDLCLHIIIFFLKFMIFNFKFQTMHRATA